MLEQRILCHKLPKAFDCMKMDNIQEPCENKRNKIIQELKRRMLNGELERYENKIQQYEHLYQQELTTLHAQIMNPTSPSHKGQVDILLYVINLYFNQQTTKFIRKIRYQESCLHAKLVRHHRRDLSSIKKTADVYPQTIVDVTNLSLNRIQLDYLSRNGKFKIVLDSCLNSSIPNKIFLIC
jgi:DNA gyrase/topoisomerase IV subunit B